MGREFEVRRDVTLEATPEQVWAAIATGPGLTAWFAPMELDPDDPGITWDPPRHLVVRTPEAADGSTQAFEYLVEARNGGGTVLRFVHSGVLGDPPAGTDPDGWGDEFEDVTGRGWDMYLHTLAQYLRYFPGRAAAYVDAEAPPASADPETWARLLSLLGPGDDLALGSPVRIGLDGAAPVEGEIDYLTPSFLGIRTADALVRFHGRAALGMPIAVGHHVYAAAGAEPDTDTAATGKAWQDWLAQLQR